jgi:hypothetical protein
VIEKAAKNGKKVTYPSEADHFVLKDAHDLIPHYGEKPTELLVYLPYAEAERNFRAYYEEFRNGGLYCQGNGRHITWAVDPGSSGDVVIRGGKVTRDYVEDGGQTYRAGDQAACPGYGKEDNPLYPRCANCRPRALLFVLVRDPQAPRQLVGRRLAYYRIATGSIRNIIELTRNFNSLRRLASYMGRDLTGIPLILRRVPGRLSVKTDKGRIQTTKYFLQIEVDPSWVQAATLAMADYALGGQTEMAALPDVDGSHPNGDYVQDVIDGDNLYVPEELEDVDGRIAQAVLDLEALKDNVPSSWGEFHSVLQEFLGTAYRQDDMLREVRARLGIGRTDKLLLDETTWAQACDLLIARFGAN